MVFKEFLFLMFMAAILYKASAHTDPKLTVVNVYSGLKGVSGGGGGNEGDIPGNDEKQSRHGFHSYEYDYDYSHEATGDRFIEWSGEIPEGLSGELNYEDVNRGHGEGLRNESSWKRDHWKDVYPQSFVHPMREKSNEEELKHHEYVNRGDADAHDQNPWKDKLSWKHEEGPWKFKPSWKQDPWEDDHPMREKPLSEENKKHHEYDVYGGNHAAHDQTPWKDELSWKHEEGPRKYEPWKYDHKLREHDTGKAHWKHKS